jgi:Uma2 family endonuclease
MSVTTLEETLPQTEEHEATTDWLIEKLYQTEGKAEIVDGEVVEFMATGDEPATAASNILVSLKLYQRKTNLGRAYTDNTGFLVTFQTENLSVPTFHFLLVKEQE